MIAEGQMTKATRRVLPPALHAKATRLLDFLVRAATPQACAIFPGFKMLHGRLHGTYQFKLDAGCRVRFQWEGDMATNITVGEFHDEDE